MMRQSCCLRQHIITQTTLIWRFDVLSARFKWRKPRRKRADDITASPGRHGRSGGQAGYASQNDIGN